MGYMFRLYGVIFRPSKTTDPISYCNNMIPYCYSNYYVNIGDSTVHLTTLLFGFVFFEGLKMTR